MATLDSSCCWVNRKRRKLSGSEINPDCWEEPEQGGRRSSSGIQITADASLILWLKTMKKLQKSYLGQWLRTFWIDSLNPVEVKDDDLQRKNAGTEAGEEQVLKQNGRRVHSSLKPELWSVKFSLDSWHPNCERIHFWGFKPPYLWCSSPVTVWNEKNW